jgi:hypothetical protein
MLKISWGTKIATLYIGFVLLIGTMVFMSMRQKIDLVSDDYYEKELAFQTKITEMNNANALSEKISYTIESDGIHLRFPSEFKKMSVNGEVYLFRPSDASKDLKLQILQTEPEFIIPIKKTSKGMYKMQISWTANNIPYFTEEIIVIP